MDFTSVDMYVLVFNPLPTQRARYGLRNDIPYLVFSHPLQTGVFFYQPISAVHAV